MPRTTIIDLARQLAEEDHDDLAYRRERLSGWNLEAFDEDQCFEEDPRDYFARNRTLYLEKAREIIALEAAR